jgi:hypothetical protein
MADKTAARRSRASHASVDVQALRASVHSRLSGRPVAVNIGTIQQHADALGRGDRSASPARSKAGSAG